MSLEKPCLKILRLGVYAALVAPFIVFPWTIYPYLYAKALYINILVAMILPFYVVLLVVRPDLKPKKNFLTLAVIGFFLILMVSGIFSADPRRAFWGTQERSAGIFFLLHYLVLFLIASSVFRDKPSWRKLLTFSLFISILVVGSTWWDIAMEKIWKPAAGTRTGGTLSNPIFYAAYLLFHIPLSLWLIFENRKKFFKVLFLLIFAILSISLFYTLTRGALLAYLGMFFLALILLIFFRRKYQKLALGTILSVVLFLVLIFTFKTNPLVAKNPILGRLASISPKEVTALTRLEAWKIAWLGFKEKPVLGWGPENYYVIFNKFYNPELLRFSYYETWSDRPHNIVFEILSTSGIIGLLVYLFIYLLVLWKSVRQIKQGRLGLKIALPLLMIFAGYFMQNLFGIDTVSTYLMFFIMLAFAGFVLESETSNGFLFDVSLRTKRPVIFAGLLTSLLSLISIWQWNIEPAYAGYLTAKAASVQTFGDAMNLWQKALDIKTPWSYDAQVEYLKGVTRLAQKSTNNQFEDIKPLLARGETAAKDLLYSHGQNAYFNYLAGRFYSEWGKFEFKYFDEAEKLFKKSIELSPRRQQLFYGLGRMYLLRGKTEEALKVFEDLVQLDPNVDESHWFYGLALRQADRGEEAYQEIKEAIRLGYNAVDSGEVLVLAEVATKEDDLIALQNIYENAIVINPKNADWYARLAALYLELGRKEEARKLVIKAVELDTTLKEEATKFLKLLQ